MNNTNDPKRLVGVKATLRVPGEPDQPTIVYLPLDVALRDGRPLAEAV
jgi:hypothetical protein